MPDSRFPAQPTERRFLSFRSEQGCIYRGAKLAARSIFAICCSDKVNFSASASKMAANQCRAVAGGLSDLECDVDRGGRGNESLSYLAKGLVASSTTCQMQL